MPYGRRSYRKKSFRKRRTLAPKSIKRRTSARSQSRQILSLSRRVRSIAKTSYEIVTTSYQRNTLPIGNLTGSNVTPYICPLPFAPCDPFGTAPPALQAQRFSDNRVVAAQQFMVKKPIFGSSQAARNAGTVTHMGGTLKYQFVTDEPSLTKISVFLVRPKKLTADELTVDRTLKNKDGSGSGADGSGAVLYTDIDYHVHSEGGFVGNTGTNFGGMMNTKYWDVLYRREISMGSPDGGNISANVSGAGTSPANNALIASGTIKLPAGGKLMNVGALAQLTSNNPPVPGNTPAFETQFVDQDNAKSCYLVCLLNDAVIDLETVKMGFVVLDRYKCPV